MDEIGKKISTATVNVDDKDSQYQLALINAKLAETAKRVASPRIDIAGAARASATIAGLELQLHKLGEEKIKIGGGDEAGRSLGRDFYNGFTGYLSGRRGDFGKFFSGLFSGAGGLNMGGVAGGMLPGILGLSGKRATLLGLGGSALGALPSLAAIGATAGGLGAGAGVIDLGIKQLIGQKNTKANPNAQGPLYAEAQQIKQALSSVMQTAAGGMTAPLKAAFAGIPGMLKGIAPALKSVFAGAGSLIGPLLTGISDLAHMVLPGLGAAFKAIAPLVTPLLDGFGRLIQGLLPGLVAMLSKAGPAIGALAGILGTLGKDLGSMFSDFAPVIGQSAVIFKALADVISALFPIVGKLAAEFASALGPVFAQVAGIVKGLLPVLSVIGQVIVSFASAVLGDLASVFGAIATLIKGIGPSLAVLAKAFSQVFNVLENSGVFAVIGDALENLAPVLAKLINTLVTGLAPVFPVLIQAVAELSTIIVNLLSAGLTTLLNLLIPVVAWVAKLIVAVIGWLQQTHLLVPVLAAVAIAMDPIGAAVVGLIAVVGLLAAHWKQIWGDIKNWTADAVNFVKGLFGDLPKPLQDVLKAYGDMWKAEWDAMLGAAKVAWAIITGVLKAAWAVISGIAKASWDEIAGVLKAVWAVISGSFKVTVDLLTGHWSAALNQIRTTGTQVWNAIKGALQGIWNALKGSADQVWNAMKGAASAAWNAMKSTAVQVWNAIKANLSAVWNGMKSAASAVWTAIKNDASGLWSALKTGFNTVVGAIGTAWGKLSGVFKAPVNFLINTVYMGGIRRLWDDVMNAIGLGSLDLPSVQGLSGGGKLPGFGGGDRRLALLEDGEAVVDKHRTAMYAPLLKAMGVPGFASGGVVGDAVDVGKMALAAATGNQVAFTNAFKDFLPGGAGGASANLAAMIATAPVAMIKHIVTGLWDKITGAAAASQSSGGSVSNAGPTGGDAAANKALARKMFPWPASMWPSYDYLEMREAGYNRFARNPSSGAYGIPQALPPTKMPYAAQAAGGSHAGPQLSWMYSYIRSVYGNPVNAAAHERSQNWYAAGGPASGLIGVGDRGRELIKVPNGSTVFTHPDSERFLAGPGSHLVQLEISPGGQSAFEQFMSGWIKNYVRIKGGGDVQKAFGRG